jgi:hypothetical protein
LLVPYFKNLTQVRQKLPQIDDSRNGKATSTIVCCLLVGSGRATMKLHCIQSSSGSAASNYIAALPMPTTMGGVTFSISEVVYWDCSDVAFTKVAVTLCRYSL